MTLPSRADKICSALLDIKKQNTSLFTVAWKVPTHGDRGQAIMPQLPDNLGVLEV